MKKFAHITVWTFVCLMLCICGHRVTVRAHAAAEDTASATVLEIPAVDAKPYDGTRQTPDLSGLDLAKYTATCAGGTDAGSYDVTLTLIDPAQYAWEGTEEPTVVIPFVIVPANNDWETNVGMTRWIAGDMPSDTDVFFGKAKFGNPRFVLTARDGTVVYDASSGTDTRETAKAGKYTLTVTVEGTKNYTGLQKEVTVEILARGGLSRWDVLFVVFAVLLLVFLILLVLWQRGILRFWSKKKELQLRTQASVDATVAAVRAADRAREAKISIARAEAQDRAEERRRIQEVEYSLSEEARASLLEARAKATERRADRLQARAEAMRTRADNLREPTAEAETGEHDET